MSGVNNFNYQTKNETNLSRQKPVISDYIRVLGQKKFEEIIYSDESLSSPFSTKRTVSLKDKLAKLEKYCENPEIQKEVLNKQNIQVKTDTDLETKRLTKAIKSLLSVFDNNKEVSKFLNYLADLSQLDIKNDSIEKKSENSKPAIKIDLNKFFERKSLTSKRTFNKHFTGNTSHNSKKVALVNQFMDKTIEREKKVQNLSDEYFINNNFANYKLSVLDPKNLDMETIEQISDLHNENFKDFHRSPYFMQEDFSNIPREPVVIIAKDNNNKVIGYLDSETIRGETYVSFVAVDKEHRGKKIGTEMFNELEMQLKLQNKNTDKIYLLFRDTGIGESFYSKLGFDSKIQMNMTYRNGDQWQEWKKIYKLNIDIVYPAYAMV